MSTNNLSTPILFIVFNRPDTTQIVFDAIRQARPKQLFIAADGPRDNHPDDAINCAQVRAIINQIDWECDVKMLLREHNLGCGRGVSLAITWFFDHVERGIILEDDCVPDQSFFSFTEQLLHRYKHEEHVMMITGTSFLFNKVQRKQSYFFAKHYPIWGWATWKRAWQRYDFTMQSWDAEKRDWLNQFFKNKNMADHWAENFEQIKSGKLDTWDIQWAYACIRHGGYSVIPYTNLISNIGLFGVHANGKKSAFHEMPVSSVPVDHLIHPARVAVDKTMNKKMYHNIFMVIRPYYSFESKIRYCARTVLRFIGLR